MASSYDSLEKISQWRIWSCTCPSNPRKGARFALVSRIKGVLSNEEALNWATAYCVIVQLDCSNAQSGTLCHPPSMSLQVFGRIFSKKEISWHISDNGWSGVRELVRVFRRLAHFSVRSMSSIGRRKKVKRLIVQSRAPDLLRTQYTSKKRLNFRN